MFQRASRIATRVHEAAIRHQNALLVRWSQPTNILAALKTGWASPPRIAKSDCLATLMFHPLDGPRLASPEVASARLRTAPRLRVSVDEPSAEKAGWVPLGAILALRRLWRGSIEVGVRSLPEKTLTEVRLWSYRRHRGLPPLESLQPALPSSGVLTSITEFQTSRRLPWGLRREAAVLLFECSTHAITELIQDVIADAAADCDVSQNEFSPTKTDPSTYTAVRGDRVNKINIAIVESGDTTTRKACSPLDEWFAMQRCDGHPGTPTPIHLKCTSRYAALASERTSGEALDCKIDRSGRSIHLERLVLSLADIRIYLHRRGVDQRDYRPGNFLVDDRGCARIIDFDHAVLFNPAEYPTRSTRPRAGVPPFNAGFSFRKLCDWLIARGLRVDTTLGYAYLAADYPEVLESKYDELCAPLEESFREALNTGIEAWHSMCWNLPPPGTSRLIVEGPGATLVSALAAIQGVRNVVAVGGNGGHPAHEERLLRTLGVGNDVHLVRSAKGLSVVASDSIWLTECKSVAMLKGYSGSGSLRVRIGFDSPLWTHRDYLYSHARCVHSERENIVMDLKGNEGLRL